MKNKKFLAGATLAAFATTLAPVAAFAADASVGASKFTVTEEVGEVNGDAVEAYVDLYDSTTGATTTLAANHALYIWAERTDDIVSDVDTLVVSGATDSLTGAGNDGVVKVLAGNITSSSIKVEATSGVSGDVVLRSAIVNTAAPGFVDTPKGWELGLIGNVTGEFEKDNTNDFTLVGDAILEDATSGSTTQAILPIAADNQANTPALNDDALLQDGEQAQTITNPGVTGGMQANGLDTVKFDLMLKDENGKDFIADEEVKISANKNGLNINKETATTDARGGFNFKVSADKPGTYEIEVEAGSNDYTLEVTFGSAGDFDIELADVIEGKIALDERTDIATLEFLDANGNTNDKVADLGLADGANVSLATAGIEFDVISEPEDSDINESTDLDLVVDGDDIVIEFAPEAEGNYEIKVALDSNGKSEVIEFEVVEQGDIVKMELDYDAESLMLGATSQTPDVYLIDADGVKAKTTSGVDFAATGKAVDNIDGSGKVTLDTDNDFAGTTVKVTAVSERHDVVATHTFTVVEEAQGIEFLTTDIAVNTDNKVQFAVVDSEGNKVALGNDYDVVDTSYVVLDKPEGAKVSVDFDNDAADLLTKGVDTIEIYSTEEGEVEIQVVVKVQVEGNGTPTTTDDEFEYYTGSAVFNVGKEAATGNAGVVTMFIGSTNFMVDGESTTMDVAPFIQDNRTFVPVRAFGEAVGAEVEYDEATQVITAVKGDVTVTMTVGKNIITTSEGETITADVAPFVKDGRTVLPLRAAAEAFGCDVEAISAVDGSTTGVIFTVK